MQLSKQSMQYDVYGVPSPHVLLMETKRQQDYKRFVVPNRNSAGTEVKIQMQAKVVHTSKVFLFFLFFLGRLKVIIDVHEDGVWTGLILTLGLQICLQATITTFTSSMKTETSMPKIIYASSSAHSKETCHSSQLVFEAGFQGAMS
jgi:hypothetical protein